MQQEQNLFETDDWPKSCQTHWESQMTFQSKGLIIMGFQSEFNETFQLQARILRSNLQIFTIQPDQIRLCCNIMNKNGKAPHLGRFIVDFYSNSIKYIYKTIVTDSLKDSEEMTNILNEVVADLKQRIDKNLLALLLAVGQTYRTFTKDKRLMESLKQEEQLQKSVDDICLSQLTQKIIEEDTSTMECETQITEDLIKKVKNIHFDDDTKSPAGKVKSQTQMKVEKTKKDDYVREGGYFKVEGKEAEIITEDKTEVQKLAIKTSKNPDDPQSMKRITNQLSIVKSISDSKYFPTYFIPENSDNKTIFMSWTTSNTMKDFINCQPLCSIRKKLRLMIDAVKAVQVLHKSNIIHRDLKPTNILLESDLNIKLIDFAESYSLKFSNIEDLKRGSTMPYAPPQFFYQEKVAPVFQSDIWSLGVLLYEIFEGRLPIHYVKYMHNDTIKNMTRFTPNIYDKQKGGIGLISRMVRKMTTQILNSETKKRLSLERIENILEMLLEYSYNIESRTIVDVS